MTVVGDFAALNLRPYFCCRDFRFRPRTLRRETSRNRDGAAWAAAEGEEGAGLHRLWVQELGVAVRVLDVPPAPPLQPRASLTAPAPPWKLASSEILMITLNTNLK